MFKHTAFQTFHFQTINDHYQLLSVCINLSQWVSKIGSLDALRTYAVQTSDTMPDISELADFIADKIEVYSEKISNLNYPVAEDTTVDFEFENQDTNVSDVEFDYDEIFASLDTENSSYYDNVSKSGVGVTFSERVSAMKEWADKALEKVNEKDMQKENVLKKNGGAR